MGDHITPDSAQILAQRVAERFSGLISKGKEAGARMEGRV